MVTLILTFGVFLGFALVLGLLAVVFGRILRGSCGGSGGGCACRDQGLARGTCETEEGRDLIQIVDVGVAPRAGGR